MESEFCNIKELAKFFNAGRLNDDSNEDDDPVQNASGKSSSKAEKSVAKTEAKVNPYAKIDNPEKEENLLTYTDENYLDAPPQISSDWKKTPKFDVTYRQQVTPSDVYLQMGAKTPATSSCENMIITVDLPGEHMQNIDMKVLHTQLTINSPAFFLDVPLPHPVDPKRGSAKWNIEQEKLIITLQMNREYDFMNF